MITLGRHSMKRSSNKTTGFFGILASVFVLILPAFLPGEAGAEKPVVTHPLDAHLSETYTEDLDALLKRKYVRVLTTFNHTNFFISKGRARGFEYSLLREYEKFINKDIKRQELRVTFDFIPVPRDRLIPALAEGYGDIAAAGLTITRPRAEIVDFTTPYLTGINELLVTHKDVPKPKSVLKLSGQRVFVRKSSSYFGSLKALNQRLKKDGKKPVDIVLADENIETEDILEMVNSGAVERTICDSHIAEIWSGVFENLLVHNDIFLRKGGNIAWAVHKGTTKLKESLDGFLRKHRKGTLMGNILFKRYYETNVFISNPAEEDDIDKLQQLRELVQKYARMYKFDWVLIAALAYQESRLDHSKKSPSGAVGIMQIRPTTAADPNVNIPKVQNLENNIHAGVKYLAFLRDRYFKDPKIRPRDRVRFSLAAYNAGPVRVRNARKAVEEMGLDPNKWFRNVEMAMLKIVGQETVVYVSNINKYYVIYKNALEARDKREKEKEKIKG